MNDFHHPSRAQAVAFLCVSLLLCVGVIGWQFFINRGTVVFVGDAPFEAAIGNETLTCVAEAPCEARIKPGTYTAVLTRPGYAPYQETVEVRWGRVPTTITPHFVFLPQIREVGAAILPHPDAPLTATYLGKEALAGLPKNTKAIFSETGTDGLLTAGDKLYLYSSTSDKTTPTKLTASSPTAWYLNSLVALEANGEGQALNLYGKTKTTIATFDRPLQNATLIANPEINNVLVSEYGIEGNNHYLIDIETGSRKRLEVLRNAVAYGATGGLFIMEETSVLKTQTVFALDAIKGKRYEIKTNNAHNVIETEPGILFYTTDVQEGAAGSISIDQAIQESQGLLSDAVASRSTIYLMQLNLATGKTVELGSIVAKRGEKIDKLRYDPVAKRLLFVKGTSLFSIDFTPQQ